MYKYIIVLVCFVFLFMGSLCHHNNSPAPTPVPPTPDPINPKLFKLFGEQKFLKGVSFFDAIRATKPGQLNSNMQYLKDLGIDIIRIFINFDWYNYHQVDNDHKIMFDKNGNLDPHKLNMLHIILQKAHEKKLVVDVSFISHPSGISETALRNGIIKVIKQIRIWKYKNVIFDLANEHHKISEATCIQLAKDIRNIVGNNYYYGISYGYTPERACDVQIRLEKCNIVRYHDPRVSGWANATAGLAKRLQKCAGNRPVYFDEPARNGWAGQNYPASDFITACGHARNAGIAAWIFHNAAGFKLHKRSFKSQLSSVEKKVIAEIGKL